MNHGTRCGTQAMHEVLLGLETSWKGKQRQGLGSELGTSAGCSRAYLWPVHTRWHSMLTAVLSFGACRENKAPGCRVLGGSGLSGPVSC